MNSWYKKLQLIIVLLLHAKNKVLEVIQQIVIFIEARFITKQVIATLAKNIVMFLKFKFDPKSQITKTMISVFIIIKKALLSI